MCMQKTKNIPGLDGLRGVAAMIVLLTHMSNWGYNLLPGFDFRGTGRSGVLLFFVLSAFLLSAQIISWPRHQLKSSGRWWRYFEARVLRIWPLFLVVLLFSLAASNLASLPYAWRWNWLLYDLPVAMSGGAFLDHLLLLKGEDILWTIPVEFKFYVLLPAILVPLIIIRTISSILAYALLTTAVLVTHFLVSAPFAGIQTLPFLSAFLCGIFLAFIFSSQGVENKSNNAETFSEIVAWLCVAVFVVSMPSIWKMLTGKEEFLLNRDSNLFWGGVWGVLICAMLRGQGTMRRILDSRPFAFIGTISFSLYLWHRLPLNVVYRLEYHHKLDYLPSIVKPALIFGASILLAYLSYILVERPVQNWRRGRRSLAKPHEIANQAS